MFDQNFSALQPIEYLTILRPAYRADIGIDSSDLIFHFFKLGELRWAASEIDDLFKEVFQGTVTDLTGAFTSKMKEVIAKKREGKEISPTFMLDIYKEVTQNPAKIHKTYSQLTNSWTYVVKEGSTPFVDIHAQKIIEGIDKIVLI